MARDDRRIPPIIDCQNRTHIFTLAMAVPIDATTVVILNEAIEKAFAGGIDAFKAVVPNATFCNDEHISRASFMKETDAEQFARELEHYQLAEEADFVILKVYMPLEEQTPQWLNSAKYEKAQIVWLAGTEVETIVAPEGWDPTEEPLQHYSAEELAEKFNFLETTDGVDTFVNKETGQKIYSSSTKPQAVRLFEDATELADSYIILDGQRNNDEEGKVKLDRAIEILEQAVALEPDYWNAWWFLGKCWQALGNAEKALENFKESVDKCGGDNPNTWREYMFECLNLGDASEGVRAAEKAVEIEPADDGIVSNLALAYLIAGRLREAALVVKQARKMNRKDPVTKNLQRIIKEVSKGKRPQPRNLKELQGG